MIEIEIELTSNEKNVTEVFQKLIDYIITKCQGVCVIKRMENNVSVMQVQNPIKVKNFAGNIKIVKTQSYLSKKYH